MGEGSARDRTRALRSVAALEEIRRLSIEDLTALEISRQIGCSIRHVFRLLAVGITAFGMQNWSGMRRIWRAEPGIGWFWDFFGAWLSATFFCGVGVGLQLV